MPLTDRRKFMLESSRATALVAATAALGGIHTQASEKQSNVCLGIIGCGSIMGQRHLQGIVNRRDAVTISWLCDVDKRQIDQKAQLIADFQSIPPKRTTRYEDILEDRDVHACIVATPHHWHAPIALAAMQADKDVYLEKPMSHVYSEGPLLIEAAKKYGRVFQHGTQMRSSPVTAQAGELLRQGIIGEIMVARAWTAEERLPIPPLKDCPPPGNVDYDRWLGPAPTRPFNPHRFHENWRMFRDYGNGEIGDDGVHDLDMAVWGLGVNTLPARICARGSRMLLRESHVSEYPDNLTVSYEYPDGRLLIYENYPFTAYGLHGFDNGNVFYGTEGYMVFSRRGAFSTFLGPKATPGPTEDKAIRGQRGYDEHMMDFLNAVRHRTATTADAEVAHRSSALVHLGEITLQTTGRLEFDLVNETCPNCPEANRMLTKQYRSPYALSL